MASIDSSGSLPFRPPLAPGAQAGRLRASRRDAGVPRRGVRPLQLVTAPSAGNANLRGPTTIGPEK